MESKLIQVTKRELSKVEDNILNTEQLSFILKKTPKSHIYTRPGKGGSKWNYVTGTYVKKVLNLVFGWDWSFEVVEHKIDLALKQAYVLGKLSVRSNGREVVKMQFGRVDIKFKRNSDQPLDVGNDLKAATTDALKKCAGELGIASDVYAPNEFKEIEIIEEPEPRTEEEKLEEIKQLMEKESNLPNDEIMHIEMIIDQQITKDYDKAIHILKKNLVK